MKAANSPETFSTVSAYDIHVAVDNVGDVSNKFQTMAFFDLDLKIVYFRSSAMT